MNRCPRLLVTLSLPLAGWISTAAADVRVPAIFGDHMVLQRETQTAVWGWADPGEQVRVAGSWSGDEASAVAGDDGRWSVALTTPGAGGPFTVSVRGRNEILLEDVLIGEVWVCSGQSNMEMAVGSSNDAQAEITAAEYPAIRLFDVAHAVSMTPVGAVTGSWVACSPETIGGFSAVGYFFGRELQRELDVPIGLVSSNWGGTLAEAWTSRETLARLPEFEGALDRVARALTSGDAAQTLDQRQAAWWAGVESVDPGLQGHWMASGLDEASWVEAPVPGRFADAGLESFDGCVWYRRTVEVPAEWAGQELVLEIGPVDDMDLTFFNGELVGATRVDGQWTTPRTYTVPAQLARGGTSVIAVCAVDTGGVGSLGVAADQRPPMRLRPREASPAGAGEQELRLEGTWKLRAGAPVAEIGSFPRREWFHQNYPTALYNGMLAPIIPFGIRGAIWYQGESNRERAAQYRTLFPAMIGDWREKWGIGDFPFYYVQIAPFRYGGDRGQAAELREAQTLALSTVNTGMAVTMDIGNPADIHPRNKQDVGGRLALWALAKTYGRDRVCSGPLYRAMVVVGDEARLYFDHAAGGLVAEGGAPTHFTIAGEDRVFHPATALIDGATLRVRSDQVPRPVAVRYAWGAADVPNLKNGAGLPAPSFRTGAWPPTSAAR